MSIKHSSSIWLRYLFIFKISEISRVYNINLFSFLFCCWIKWIILIYQKVFSLNLWSFHLTFCRILWFFINEWPFLINMANRVIIFIMQRKMFNILIINLIEWLWLQLQRIKIRILVNNIFWRWKGFKL